MNMVCFICALLACAFYVGVFCLVIGLCMLAKEADEKTEEYFRKEGQEDGCNNLFGTDKETGQDGQKQTKRSEPLE